MAQTRANNKVVWQAEAQNLERSDLVKEALREVIDPEIGLNVIELGLIRDLAFQTDGSTWVKMILTTPFCPYGPAMLDQTRNKVSSVTDAPTKIEMGMELWDPSMMEEGAGADWGLF
ncbi:MAG: metal-sulfur cluster assembly factor [Anaerolineales bacterium]|nr:metal-sulfur cluster assembly factor [Anaerolineales bacterium]